MQEISLKDIQTQSFFQNGPRHEWCLDFPLLQNQNSLDLIISPEDPEHTSFPSQPLNQDIDQIKELQSTPELQQTKGTKKQKCKCKKTQCLKMYCQCFSQGLKCGPECVCIGCSNSQESGQASLTKRKALYAKSSKFIMEGKAGLGKGCNCKKSHCQKKYCQCLNAGRPCTEACQCIECHNCAETGQLNQKSKVAENIKLKQSTIESEQDFLIEESQKYCCLGSEKEQTTYLVLSNEVLAEIDGYING